MIDDEEEDEEDDDEEVDPDAPPSPSVSPPPSPILGTLKSRPTTLNLTTAVSQVHNNSKSRCVHLPLLKTQMRPYTVLLSALFRIR